MDLHKAKPGDEDRWRVYTYSKCTYRSVSVILPIFTVACTPGIRALKNHPKRIKSLADARLVRGVGAKTASKVSTPLILTYTPPNTYVPHPKQIMEVVQTGGLRRIDYEKTDDVEAMQLFQGIYGVGMSLMHLISVHVLSGPDPLYSRAQNRHHVGS